MFHGQMMPVPARRGETRAGVSSVRERATLKEYGRLVLSSCAVSRSSALHEAALGALLFLLAALVPAHEAQAIYSEASEILASGDEVEGLGRIGYAHFSVAGISRDDRVVFTAEISTGAEGVFSADGNTIQTLWLTTGPEGSPARLGRVRTNANRVVVAEGFSTPDIYGDIDGFYQISAGVAVPVIELGDVTPQGDEICFLEDFVVSDAGAVAFSAYAAPPEAECASDEWSENLYVFEAGSIRRLLRSGDAQPPGFVLIGLADDGTLLVGYTDRSAILRVRDGQVERIVSGTDLSPTAGPFGFVEGRASNSLGEIAFGANGPILYRTHDGEVSLATGIGDTVDTKYALDIFDSVALNDAGAIVLHGQLQGGGGPPLQAAVLFPPVGSPRLLAPFGTPAGINDSGVVAVLEQVGSTAGPSFVARGSDAPLERLVAFGDAVPEGGVFATGGIISAGLAPDGRVAAVVSSSASSSSVLACGDAEGFVALTGPSNPTRDGGTVTPEGWFAFADTGLLFLGTEGEEPASVYLATDAGLERLLGPGDSTADGARILEFAPFLDGFGTSRIASNARGSVLVRARTDHGVRFLRRQPAGGLETIPFALGPDLLIQRNISAGIEDDGTVAISVELASGEYAILTSDGTSARLLATGSDPMLPGGPFGSMTLSFVVGDRIVIRADASDNSGQRNLSYTASTGFVPFFADEIERVVDDATAGGRALVESSGDANQFLMLPDGSLSFVGSYLGQGKPMAIAINDRDNLLFITDGTELGTQRDSLSLAGPTPSERCPRAPTPETPEPTATPSSTETSTPTATPPVTPTHTPKPTDAPTATQTAEPTRTAPPTETGVASPSPTAGPADSDDGCQVAPSQGSTLWPLLPMLVVLGGIFRRFPNRRARPPVCDRCRRGSRTRFHT